MRDAKPVDGGLQRLDDLARADAIGRHHIVQREGADVFLEGGRRTGIDHLDAKRPRRGDRPGDIVLDHLRGGVVADHRQQEIVIAENGERRLVDDRDVGEFEMGVKCGSRRHRRLDHRRETHLGVEAAGLEGRPAGIGERRRRRPRLVRGVLLGQQQPRRIHVAAADVGMDVDGARHDDAAGRRRWSGRQRPPPAPQRSCRR